MGIRYDREPESRHVPIDNDDRPTAYFIRGEPEDRPRGLAQHLDAVIELLDALDTSLQKLADALTPVLKTASAPAQQKEATREKVTPLSDRVDGMRRHAYELVAYTRALTDRVYL